MSLDLVNLAFDAAHHAHHSMNLADVPDPSKGGGEAPPGAEKLTTILKWVFYAVSMLCVAGILVVAGTMAIQHRRGEGSEAMAGLGKVLFACVLAGSASGLVGALL